MEWSGKSYRHASKNDARQFDFKDREHRSALYRRYLQEHPEEEGKFVLLVNCLNIRNPELDPALTKHVGQHPKTMYDCAKYMDDEEYRDIATTISGWTRHHVDEADLLIIFVCKVERHRSVALCELMEQWLDRKRKEMNIEFKRVPMNKDHWSKLCVNWKNPCLQCNWEDDEAMKRVNSAIDLFEDRLDGMFGGTRIHVRDGTKKILQRTGKETIEYHRRELREHESAEVKRLMTKGQDARAKSAPGKFSDTPKVAAVSRKDGPNKWAAAARASTAQRADASMRTVLKSSGSKDPTPKKSPPPPQPDRRVDLTNASPPREREKEPPTEYIGSKEEVTAIIEWINGLEEVDKTQLCDNMMMLLPNESNHPDDRATDEKIFQITMVHRLGIAVAKHWMRNMLPNEGRLPKPPSEPRPGSVTASAEKKRGRSRESRSSRAEPLPAAGAKASDDKRDKGSKRRRGERERERDSEPSRPPARLRPADDAEAARKRRPVVLSAVREARDASRSPRRGSPVSDEGENLRQIAEENPTGDEWIDADPEDIPDDTLDALFENRKTSRNFITYIGSSNRTDKKIRVNCKYFPKNNEVACPPFMRTFRKTTLVQRQGNPCWEVLACRRLVDDVSPIGDDVQKMCIFLQEQRYTPQGFA